MHYFQGSREHRPPSGGLNTLDLFQLINTVRHVSVSNLNAKATLVNVKAPVVATTNWWWLISALVVA